MLVLTRKYQEKVHIGDGITITILRTKGKAVRLGIEAPAEVPVIRGELTFNELPVESVEKPAKREPRKARRSAGWDANAADTKAASQVTLQRVPREKSAEILPRLLSGNAPLRGMLEQRSRAV
jgi:carbon storage regulator CsrA